VEAENRLLTHDEIYRILSTALARKFPEPPADWCASGLDEEVRKATREYEPNAYLRQKDALCTSLNYLVDFALRMPEWINLTASNDRVKQICENLAAEIVKITLEPEAIINKHGKLKAWLKAILSVETCLIYRTETERVIAEETEAKRLPRIEQSKKSSTEKSESEGKWQSALAKSIFQKASGKKSEKPSEQPSLF
jgi:hypothetical protein